MCYLYVQHWEKPFGFLVFNRLISDTHAFHLHLYLQGFNELCLLWFNIWNPEHGWRPLSQHVSYERHRSSCKSGYNVYSQQVSIVFPVSFLKSVFCILSFFFFFISFCLILYNVENIISKIYSWHFVRHSCIPDKVFRDFNPFWIFPSYTSGCKTTSCLNTIVEARLCKKKNL